VYKNGSYTQRKNGTYYFVRRVPKNFEHHYCSSRITFSLRTKSLKVASQRAAEFASRLDAYWFSLSLEDDRNLGRFFQKQTNTEVLRQETSSPKTSGLTLSESLELYLRLKGNNRPLTFHQGATRVCGQLIAAHGDKLVADYTRADAIQFRDHLIEKGMAGNSIVRVMGNIRAIMNFAASEMGQSQNLAFTRLYIDRKAGAKERQPVSNEHLALIKNHCFRMDDEKRWILALIADTGLRLSEAAGLLKSDFEIRDEIPAVVVQPHPSRRLKTSKSARVVPLVGASLWASKRIATASVESQYAFPIYNKSGITNGNSCSAALNKWLNSQIEGCGSVHSLRHSLRDRLRSVECPSDVVDQIGGWSTTSSVGNSYGTGYPLSVLHKWLLKIV
jgi:integrase